MGIKNPIFCDIGITENCMFKCKMCRLWQSPKNIQELSIEEWKNFIISLEELGANKIRLHLAGGEPLVKAGVLDLIEFANKKGFTTVMVSNGFLIDEAMAKRIVSSGLDVISISLDSIDEATHDFLRGIPGAYRQALQAIDCLSKHGVKSISILSVIMGANLHNLIELADWINQNASLSSVYFQAISQPLAMPKDQQWFEKAELGYLWPKDKIQLDSVIDQLIARKNQGYKISNSVRQLEIFKSYFKQPDKVHGDMVCNQGDYVIYIRPTGEVLLCGSMPPIGNIRTESIKKLWNSQEAALRRKQIYACTESCLNVINCFENKDLP
jgi:AdoMet-dependent heme synthase